MTLHRVKRRGLLRKGRDRRNHLRDNYGKRDSDPNTLKSILWPPRDRKGSGTRDECCRDQDVLPTEHREVWRIFMDEPPKA